MSTAPLPAPAHRRATRARVAASIGVLGAAAAVAGLGTHGTFTDSTAPVVGEVRSGVLSIALTEAAGSATLSLFDDGRFLAGDSQSSAIDLVNDGDVALGELRLTSVATASSALDADPVHGLQLSAQTCSQPWEPTGSTCGGTARELYAGPIVADVALAGLASRAPGGVDHLLLTARLPGTATADLVQGARSSLDFTFGAVQRDGGPR